MKRTEETLKGKEDKQGKTGCSIMMIGCKRRNRMNLYVNNGLGRRFLSSKEDFVEAHTADYISSTLTSALGNLAKDIIKE